MYSSFSTFSIPFGLPRFLGGNPGTAIDIKPVEVYDIDTKPEKSARTLKHLLKLNHAKHAILFNHMKFHNHMPHILGSAYLMKSSPEHLDEIYAEESKELDSWKDSPGEVSTYDWRDYLGDKKYERAFVDFFEDQLVLNGYDLKKLLDTYLYTGKEPLINNLVAGLGHPLIHLGYSFELSSRDVAVEALGLAATQYNFLHKYLDDLKYTKPSSYSTSSPLGILEQVRDDKRFDKGSDGIEAVFENHEAALLEHWNAWQLPNPSKQFEDSQYAAVAILVAMHPPNSVRSAYDFFLVHLLTSSHAVRITLPFIPAKFHVSLVRQWWLFTLAVYIAQGRPKVDLANITDYKLKGQDWSDIDKHAVQGKWSLDAHWVKALRAMKEAANTWGDADQFYLKAACRFDEEFDGWGGFDLGIWPL